MKKILIINGHPNSGSLNHALADAYKKGAVSQNAEVRQIDIAELDFDASTFKSFDSFTIPGDLAKAQNDIKWADHLVWIYPTWWATMPAIMKSFFEQTFLMGFAALYDENGKVTQLLKNKTARIISTMDTPVWMFKFLLGDPAFKTNKANLNFCGIKPVKRTYFGPVVTSDKTARLKWLKQTEELGRKLL
jgi:putative NADPH-quinone reductase